MFGWNRSFLSGLFNIQDSTVNRLTEKTNVSSRGALLKDACWWKERMTNLEKHTLVDSLQISSHCANYTFGNGRSFSIYLKFKYL